MASLFGKNKLRDIASKLNTQSLEEKIAIVKTWHNDYHNGSLKQDKETSREQAYNQDFFIKILGYKEKPATPYSFEPKASTLNGQLPDAVICYTNVSENIANISAVIELKGASVFLERPQRREGNMSPVQQAFKYKTQYRNCPFVIVSNFWEFRLYRDNQLDYEIWTLDDLVDPEDDYLKFKTFCTLLHSDNFTSSKGTSKTEGLLSDIRFEQEEIGKKFYKVYRDARLELLRDIYRKNSIVRSDIDTGIKKAQKIIDRIVFACFAEDRGLLPDNTLHRVIKASDNSVFGGSLWNTLKGFFEAIDVGSEKLEIPDGYNGGLFKKDEILNNLQISDEALHAVIDLSNYNFAEDLSVTILGHIFEQSISDLEEIKNKVNESQNIEDLQQSRRKKDGIFYTPDYIVHYIVENSLGAYLREHEEKFKDEFSLKGDINDQNYEKREKQAYSKYQQFLQKVKIVDPACGSGAFLVYVVDYLLAENERVASILGNNIFSVDDYVKSILQNNIYGVDLNEESVEITKLSLWLKTAKKGKKLTALDNNIKCGNSLIDDSAVAGDKAFNWKEEFLEVFQNGGFDVVIGNPPYVFLRGKNMNPAENQYYRSTYLLYKFKPRTDIYFFEKAFSILRSGGYISFIAPNNILTIRSLSAFREYVLTKLGKIRIVNILDKVFADANVDTMVASFKNDSSDNSIAATVLEKGVFGDALNLDKRIFLSGDNIINFQMHDNPEKALLVRKIEQSATKMKDLLKISNGLVAYKVNNGVPKQDRLMAEQRIYHAFNKKDPDWMPYLGGSDVKRYHYKWSGEYIKYGINLGESRRKEIFSDVHMLVRVIPSKPPYSINAMLVPGNVYNDQNYIVAYGERDILKLQCICAVLNSKLMSFWFVNKLGKMQRGLFPQMKAGELAEFPVFLSKENTELGTSAAKIFQIVKELRDKSFHFMQLIKSEFHLEKFSIKLNRWWVLDFTDFVSSFKQKMSLQQKDELLNLFGRYRTECLNLDNEIKKTDHEIDQLVYKLYNLTPEDVATIEINHD